MASGEHSIDAEALPTPGRGIPTPKSGMDAVEARRERVAVARTKRLVDTENPALALVPIIRGTEQTESRELQTPEKGKRTKKGSSSRDCVCTGVAHARANESLR